MTITFFVACRYVERNALRAKFVSMAEGWPSIDPAAFWTVAYAAKTIRPNSLMAAKDVSAAPPLWPKTTTLFGSTAGNFLTASTIARQSATESGDCGSRLLPQRTDRHITGGELIPYVPQHGLSDWRQRPSA